MFDALVVSNIKETPRWMTEHVSFKSEAHALPFINGTALDDLPDGNILRLTPVYPPDGQTAESFTVASTTALTSSSEAQAVAVAEAVRNNPPEALKRHRINCSTPIFVIDPQSNQVRTLALA